MKLRTRVILLYLFIVILVLVLIGGVLPASLQQQNLDAISADSLGQLRHIDFALTNFIREAGYDVRELSLNDRLREGDDDGFTSFLNASEETFRYSPGSEEQEIIGILRNYQGSHPYVSSVYMGRENGAFVRSWPRARPTAYDPRERPWYVLAREHPGEVSVTEPYRAVTTPDVNIGIVTPLLDRNGTVIGVVGADITLVNLTRYIADVGSEDGDEMILTDRQGIILASRDSSHLFMNISVLLGEQTPVFLAQDEGVMVLEGRYLMYYTSPGLGWKIGSFVPFSTIDRRISESIQGILLFVIIALVLLSAITLIGLNYAVIRPIASLTEVSGRIAETGDLNQTIGTEGAGEIGSLARSFRAMVGTIRTKEEERQKADERTRLANRKLALMTDVTYQDIQNKVTAVRGYIELGKNPRTEEERRAFIEKEETTLESIHGVIASTKDYQQMGVDQSRWIAMEPVFRLQFTHLSRRQGIVLDCVLDGLEIHADPLIDRVVFNLLQNAVRHGGAVSRISVSCRETPDGLELVCEDNGIGIPEGEKAGIFNRVVGGQGKFGLFFVREFLSLAGMSITENGVPGKGARFAISVPKGLYRFPGRTP